jgi:beta-glucanase (GH16 family)
LDCNRADETHDTAPAPADVSTNYHEYRVDWTPGVVKFYTDGSLKKTFTTNVPTDGGSWLLNIWSNGDPGFSVGPPKNDALFKINNIVMYYNTTS